MFGPLFEVQITGWLFTLPNLYKKQSYAENKY